MQLYRIETRYYSCKEDTTFGANSLPPPGTTFKIPGGWKKFSPGKVKYFFLGGSEKFRPRKIDHYSDLEREKYFLFPAKNLTFRWGDHSLSRR